VRKWITTLLLIFAFAPVSGEESPWPVGDLVFGVDEQFSDPCAELHGDASDGWTLWIGAWIDHRKIGEAALNDVPSLAGWRAKIDVTTNTLVSSGLYPLGGTAVDLDDDPAVFDVRLPAAQLVDADAIVPLLRLTFAGAIDGPVLILGPDGYGSVPTWDSAATSDDCPAPCTRPFRSRALEAASWQGGWSACAPDAACDALIERPLPGTAWLAGSVQRVLYSTVDWPHATTRRTIPGWFELSADGGQTWRREVNFAEALTGWFDWTVPSDVSGEVLIRVRDACPLGGPDPVSLTILEQTRNEVRSWGAVKGRYRQP
jgi:hypothetical protein